MGVCQYFFRKDEAHRIKNWKSKTSKAVKQLQAEYKWTATGTPMQNKPEELFNIFAFTDPSILGVWWKFRKKYIIIGEKFKQKNMVLGYKNLAYLHQKISPYMLRRLKKDVAPELPEIIISNRIIPMYKEQFDIHELAREELIEIIKQVSKYTERDENGEVIKQHPKANQVLGLFTMLQEICDTPELLKISDSKMAKRYAIDKNKCLKLEELEAILKEFLETSRENDTDTSIKKAVIFTQFSRMQQIIINKISKIGKCEIINGSMNAVEKQKHLVNFKLNPNIQFMVCTDAANYGVNLEQASLLVNFDLPWNPAVWEQRNARIHRLSSKHKNIYIINLISQNGLDERILEMLYYKKSMAKTIVENTESEKQHLSYLNNTIMKKLLKKKKK